MRSRLTLVILCAAAALSARAQPDLESGKRSYEVCAGCHGFLGEGNRSSSTPRLAGIEPWYLQRQIQNFEARRRGYDDRDASGHRMALMAQAVDSERELVDLLAWIGTLPVPETPTLQTAATDETSRGEALYAPCSACHGVDGQGNEALGAPALVTLDSWYVAEQLQRYADGLRGTQPNDVYGAQMRALAASFDTAEEQEALAGYISTLRPQQ